MNRESQGKPNRPPDRKPDKVMPIPRGYIPFIGYETLQNYCKFWHDESDCEVIQRREQGRLIAFEFYGSSTAVDAAYRIVTKWIGTAQTKSTATTKWAKTPAYDNTKWYYDEVVAMEKERKEKFKGPKPSEELPEKVTVPWPDDLQKDGQKMTPRDVWGTSLERLDYLRTEDEVYITMMPPGREHSAWTVEVSGYDVVHVRAGVSHYKNLIQKYREELGCIKEEHAIILDGSAGTEVVFLKAEEWWPKCDEKIVPYLQVAKNGSQTHKKVSSAFDLARMQARIRKALESVRYARGYYDFAVRYGSLSLAGLTEGKAGQRYSLSTFEESVSKGGNTCVVKRWLVSSNGGERILRRLISAKQLFEPVKGSSGFFSRMPSSLEDIRPTFRGTWILKDPSPTERPVVVQVEFTEDENDQYERMPPRFYRLKRDEQAPKEHMNIDLLHLTKGRAWQFGLDSVDPVPKSTISPLIISFAKSVQMKAGYKASDAPKSGCLQWTSNSSTRIITGRLERVYTFGIQNTAYYLEAQTLWYPRAESPCWGFAVRHRDWEMHLSQLERLYPGTGADWNDAISTFFPDDGVTSRSSSNQADIQSSLVDLSLSDDEGQAVSQGVKLLIQKLKEVSQVINTPLPDQGPDPMPEMISPRKPGPSLGAGLSLANLLK